MKLNIPVHVTSMFSFFFLNQNDLNGENGQPGKSSGLNRKLQKRNFKHKAVYC